MGYAVQPLVDQPSGAPTRKWTAATIAEGLMTVAALGAFFGFDVLDQENANAIAGGFVAVTVALGRVVGYFTKNRAT